MVPDPICYLEIQQKYIVLYLPVIQQRIETWNIGFKCWLRPRQTCYHYGSTLITGRTKIFLKIQPDAAVPWWFPYSNYFTHFHVFKKEIALYIKTITYLLITNKNNKATKIVIMLICFYLIFQFILCWYMKCFVLFILFYTCFSCVLLLCFVVLCIWLKISKVVYLHNADLK